MKKITDDPEARAIYEAELSRIQAIDREVNQMLDQPSRARSQREPNER